MKNDIVFEKNLIPDRDSLIYLYDSVGWGHSNCPNALVEAVKNSSYVVTAKVGDKLIGIGRVISDGAITAYFPDLLVHSEWQGKGIGTRIMKILLDVYGEFHNQVLIAEDKKAKEFYKKIGFAEEKFSLSIIKPFPDEPVDNR